jgi:peptidoglycan/xylan/chitin deacetylase (PgdA/CDA1 family)
MSEDAELRAVTGGPGSRLAALLGEGLEPVTPLRGRSGPPDRVIAAIAPAGEAAGVAGEGLPEGPALAEATGVRLRRAGGDLGWAEPVTVPDVDALLSLCRTRGESSVEVIRADPSLLTGMQIGAWFDAPWRTRLARRLVRGPLRRLTAALALRSRRLLLAACDLEFWAGVRRRAGAEEWRRLTASSYVALVYHRFAGDLEPGQERIDIAPGRFRRQLLALRALGFRPLPAADLVSFHAGDRETLRRGSVVITVDDAIADCVAPLQRNSAWKPQLYVPTAEAGSSAWWLGGEPVAGWEEIQGLESAGVAIGSHARHHVRLPGLPATERDEELAGALADLRRELRRPLAIVAYPNGDQDELTCQAARRAGYRAGFTTEKGRNGAGTDPWTLKRVSVHGRDGVPAVLWKVLTGTGLPPLWLRARALLYREHVSS